MTVNEWRAACRGIRKILERDYSDAPRWTYGDYKGEKSWPLADASGRHIGNKDQVYIRISREQSAVWRFVTAGAAA